jgi:hypothetical protein
MSKKQLVVFFINLTNPTDFELIEKYHFPKLAYFSTLKISLKTRGIPQSREAFAEHFIGKTSLSWCFSLSENNCFLKYCAADVAMQRIYPFLALHCNASILL